MFFSIVKQTKFHVSIGNNQVLDGSEGNRLKSLLWRSSTQWPTLVTIVGPLAGHLLLQMLHMTLINGLCYPCSMHDHCPSDHSLFPCQLAIIQTIHYCIHDVGHWGSCGHVSFFFLSFFLFRGRCFDVQLCAPPGTSQLRALATLATIANAFRRIIP